MNNAEILEIRKRIKKKDCSITRITGCYVIGADREIRTYIDETFLNMEEDEQFKYIDILKKGLSGTLGKNLLNLEFMPEAEETGGICQCLLGLRESELKNKEMLDAFYRSVIESYDYAGNYVILLIHDVYDVPTMTSDKLKLDESEEVYRYLLCCICPVNLSKPGLSYHEEENRISNRLRDWVVDAPDTAFLFPAFNDRSEDIHNILYYVKNTDELHEELSQEILCCKPVIPADKQKKAFRSIIEDVVNDAPEYDTLEIVRSVNDSLTEMLEENDASTPVLLDREGIKEVFRTSGIDERHLDIVDEKFIKAVGEEAVLDVDSIAEKKSLRIKTNDIDIQVKQDNSDLIEVRIIEGRKYMLIPMDVDIEVNGIVKKIQERMDEEQ